VTWPDGIALAVGITTLALLTHQHRSTTQPNPRTEAPNGHQDDPQDHGEEDPREEDGTRP
jgi:hypothetical protein